MMDGRFCAIWIFLFVLLIGFIAEAQEATPNAETPFLPDDLEVITAENAGRVELVGMLGRGRLNDVDWSPNSRLLAVATQIGIWIYNLDTPQAEPRLLPSQNGPNYRVLFSPDGMSVAGFGTSGVQLWDLATETSHILIPDDAYEPPLGITFNPDWSLFAVGTEDGTVRLFDVDTRQARQTVQGSSSAISYIAFSPNGRLLAAGNQDKIVQVWDLETGQLLSSTEQRYLDGIQFSPDGTVLAIKEDSSGIMLWNFNTGEESHIQPGFVADFTFSPDSSLLAPVDAGNQVRVWNVQTGELDKQFESGISGIYSLAFSPRGEILASGNNNGEIAVWDAEIGEQLFVLTGHTSRSTR